MPTGNAGLTGTRPINVYGFPHKDRGKQGVPSGNEVFSDPGHEVRAWGEKYEGLGPDKPHVNEGVGDEALEGGGTFLEDRVYGSKNDTLLFEGVPSGKAL